jgi:ribosomal protein S18 acetylase RimI-like enzyme
MIIRIYQQTDKEQVIALWKEVFNPKKPHNNPETAINIKVKHNDNLFFVAEKDNQIIGTILVGFDGHRGWIYSLAVLQKFRSKGIGKSLVEKAVEELKKLGCLKVNLQINGDNATVLDFYKKSGFSIEDRISMGKTLY